MRKILVVEDAPSLRKDIVEMLGFEGFETEGAENGIVGVEKAREFLPDLIVCDIMMPELDGYGVLEELRKDTATAAIPFIFLTARTDRVDIRQGMDLGADDYLTKPFHAAELLATVRARLEKRDMIAKISKEQLEELRGNIIIALPHELRTPLNVMLGFSDLLMTDAQSMDVSRITEMARHINASALRLYRLIENFLVYAHTEIMFSDPAQFENITRSYTIYPQTLINHHALQKARQFERVDDFVIELEPVSAIGIAEEYVKKIVEELVDNACKFSAADTPVEVRAAVEGGFYRISVTNEGRGMTPEQIAKVGAYMQFERRLFEQQGAGLGLIICKRLAELHGGKLEIDSKVNQRTTVSVKLLVKEDAAALQTLPPQ